MSTVAVVDYGMGNLRSVSQAVKAAAADSGHQVLVTNRPDEVRAAERVVLPGQGAMPDCMHELRASGLLAAHLRAAGVEPAGPAETTHLRVIANLTPGDFGVVARQHRFRPLTTAAAWVSALEAECRLKPGQARSRIGFPGAAS